MIDRRALLRHALGAALVGVGLSRARAVAGAGEPVVIVRQPGGAVVMVSRDDTVPVRWPLPATPASVEDDLATPVAAPPVLNGAIPEGSIGYWMVSPDREAFVFRVDSDRDSSWWWRRGSDPVVRLDLPEDLEPALPSGTEGRWFHGATVDAAHLGSGELRLFAVELATGEIVLDHAFDRRLELSATAVSDGGAVVAHVQGGNTAIEIWAADLRDPVRTFEVGAGHDPAPVAPSAIDLRVVEDGDGMLVAAGLSWAWPEHPEPMVYVMWGRTPDGVGITSIPGELIDIVPGSQVIADTP